jgi:hypothetical protein
LMYGVTGLQQELYPQLPSLQVTAACWYSPSGSRGQRRRTWQRVCQNLVGIL